jgi:hypothetical protein
MVDVEKFLSRRVQEIHGGGSTVVSSIVVQKKNSESFGQQFCTIYAHFVLSSH